MDEQRKMAEAYCIVRIVAFLTTSAFQKVSRISLLRFWLDFLLSKGLKTFKYISYQKFSLMYLLSAYTFCTEHPLIPTKCLKISKDMSLCNIF
ncbi:MAG: hypothetical protein HC815_41045 [Richelia sp. RM1_1_1]|nr:hypothetical protein [Richelia sp. RM1_1_1]